MVAYFDLACKMKDNMRDYHFKIRLIFVNMKHENVDIYLNEVAC